MKLIHFAIISLIGGVALAQSEKGYPPPQDDPASPSSVSVRGGDSSGDGALTDGTSTRNLKVSTTNSNACNNSITDNVLYREKIKKLREENQDYVARLKTDEREIADLNKIVSKICIEARANKISDQCPGQGTSDSETRKY